MTPVLELASASKTFAAVKYANSSSVVWRARPISTFEETESPASDDEVDAASAIEFSRLARRFASPDYLPATTSASAPSHTTTGRVTFAELAASAQLALSTLEAAHGPATPEARRTFKVVLSALLAPGGPTPQPNVGEDGDIEVRWLVGGDLISALIYEDGAWRLRGVRADGEVIFSRRFGVSSYPDGGTLRVAADQLASMGRRVRFPALTRG